jgi:hypothetical protein
MHHLNTLGDSAKPNDLHRSQIVWLAIAFQPNLCAAINKDVHTSIRNLNAFLHHALQTSAPAVFKL